MAAPKSFPSFPSFSSFPSQEPGPSQPRQSGQSDKVKANKSHRSKDKEHKQRKRDRNSPDDASYRQKDDEPTRFYYSDRKADPLNIEYGCLHRGDIPKYAPFNHGRKILGLSSAYTAFSRTDKGIEVGRHRRQITLSDRTKSLRILSHPARRLVTRSTDSTKYQEVDGFLRLPSRGNRADDSSYRSITREDNSDSDSASTTSDPDSSDDEPAYTSYQETFRQLEQQTSTNPTDITNWLNLLSLRLSTVDVTSKDASRARAEISVSYLSRALSAHPTNATSRSLRIKYLRAGEEIWSMEECHREWENALKLNEVDLWMEWFEWKIATPDNGLDGITEAAQRILSSLDDSEDSEVGKVRVLWRTVIALRQAGYTERATAMFQAQAELMFEIPQALYGLSFESRLEAFEEFWDSEVPRMGEPESKGWSHWASQNRKVEDPVRIPSPIVTPKSTELDPYRQWAEYELQTDRTSWLPTRSSADDNDSDPYATVLLADIQPLLLDLQTQRAKHVFRLAWLSILGLHLPGFSASLSTTGDGWDDRWSYSHLTSPTFLDQVFPAAENHQVNLTADSVAGVLVGRQKTYTNSFGPMKNWSWGSLSPFDPIFGSTGMWDRSDAAEVDTGLVRRVFASLRLGLGDEEWDLLALAFEAASSVKSALKLSRSFLSDARDSLSHWAAHAQLSRMSGKLNDARKVYQTVLIASATPMPRPGACFLWWDWAEMEWLEGRTEDALSVILRAAKVEGRGGVAILRAKRAIHDSRKDCSSWSEVEAWIKLGALLDLLTSHDALAALASFEEQLGETEVGEIAHESLTMASSLFLFRHGSVLKNPVPPSVLRERVIRAAEQYPSNSIVLALFLEVEKGQGVWGRIRGTLGDTGENKKDIARRVEEIWIARWESGRWEAEIERTRIGLAGAVEHERTRGSQQLWRLCIEFEIRANQNKRARSLLYRALKQCPQSKELYLLAFGPLRSVFESQELNTFAEAMVERGIRMRKGLDEILEDWKPDMDKVDKFLAENEAEIEDDIEYNANELRRLKPY